MMRILDGKNLTLIGFSFKLNIFTLIVQVQKITKEKNKNLSGSNPKIQKIFIVRHCSTFFKDYF